MKLSKSLLAIPVVSFLVAAGVASGACSASVSVSVPGDAVVAYSGSEAIPDGIVFGTTDCSGDIYFVLGDGWGFCDGGVWDYTDLDPTGFGDYTLDDSISGGSGTGGSGTGGSGTGGSGTGGSGTGGSGTGGSGTGGSGTGGSGTAGGSDTGGGSGTGGGGGSST